MKVILLPDVHCIMIACECLELSEILVNCFYHNTADELKIKMKFDILLKAVCKGTIPHAVLGWIVKQPSKNMRMSVTIQL